MVKISVDVKRPDFVYDVFIERGALAKIGDYVSELSPTMVAIVSNANVFGKHGDVVMESLKNAGMNPAMILVSDGEKYKTLETAEHVIKRMLDKGCDRGSLVIPLGGGVTGDVAAFVASVFMRGVDCVHLPTSLIAQVDSSIGGKTAVDTQQGKNLMGTFHHPKMVVIDPDVLDTLPKIEFANGLVECVKASLIGSPGLLGLIELLDFENDGEGNPEAQPARFSQSLIHSIIKTTVKVKAKIVSQDPHESGARMLLNLGHTTGHAIEAVSGYTHGQAVALGIKAAFFISDVMGVLEDQNLPRRVEELFDRIGMPVRMKEQIDHDSIIETMYNDKKRRGKKMNFILPVAPGRSKITTEVEEETIREALKFISR